MRAGLRIASALMEAAALKDELKDFKRKVSEAELRGTLAGKRTTT
jgi:hypothetical protein